MFRSRVLTSIDVSRLADAVQRPGIDPRVWVSYAILLSDPVVETSQGQQDVFVDLLLLPQKQPETARVGAIYAGNGFGLYAPLKKDDEVMVCAPSGDPDEGLVVTQRLWSPSDTPPQEAVDYPNDFLLVVEPGQSARISVSGGGKVYLGSATGTQASVRGTTYRTAEDSLFTALSAMQAAVGAFVAVPSPANQAAVATALTAYNAAKTAFDQGASGYITDTVVLP